MWSLITADYGHLKQQAQSDTWKLWAT